MNRLREIIRNYKYWMGISLFSLAANAALSAAAIYYYREAKSEINYMTVYWHKSNTAFRPNISYPGVCYEKEIVVNGKEK